MDYLRALDKEMELTVRQPAWTNQKHICRRRDSTVLKPDEMEYFLQSVKRHFPEWSDDIEFSMEANPAPRIWRSCIRHARRRREPHQLQGAGLPEQR